MARRAAELVNARDSVALDAGPAAYELARALLDDFTGSVITHSMPVMQLLAERATDSAGPRLVALGGELTGNRQAFVGPTTLDVIAGLRARTFFLDAAAVDVRGTYACSTAEARVERGLTEIADEVVLLAPGGGVHRVRAGPRREAGPAHRRGDRRIPAGPLWPPRSTARASPCTSQAELRASLRPGDQACSRTRAGPPVGPAARPLDAGAPGA